MWKKNKNESVLLTGFSKLELGGPEEVWLIQVSG